MKIKLTEIPKTDINIIKSSVGVLLGFIIYLIRGKEGTP